MKHIAPELLQDRSTETEFRFTMRCVACGEVWESEPIPFSRAGYEPETEGKRVILNALYKQEQMTARQRAARRFEEHFSLCPICGRLVCDHCFLICEDIDMCRSCAALLKETGEPVAERVAPAGPGDCA